MQVSWVYTFKEISQKFHPATFIYILLPLTMSYGCLYLQEKLGNVVLLTEHIAQI